MKIKSIVITKNNQIICGYLTINKDIKFINEKVYKTLKEIEFLNDYKLFNKDYKILGLSLFKKDIKQLFKRLSIKTIYFYDKQPVLPNKSEFNRYWFKYKNNICQNCINKCKQSSRVEIIYCKRRRING